MAMASPASHKPRRKGKTNGVDLDVRPRAEAPSKAPLFPLAGFLWPLRSASSQWTVLPLVLMVAGLFRWAAGLWGYSGAFSLSPPLLPAQQRPPNKQKR